MRLRETELINLEESGLQEHIAYWAQVLDRWVQSIDRRLGLNEGGVAAPSPHEADAGPSAEP